MKKALKEPWLITVQVAKYLEVSPSTLTVWRHRNKGPAYYKIGGLVRYRQSDIDTFIETRRCIRSDR